MNGGKQHVQDLALLRTKLYRPPLTADLVPRPGLLERLDRHRRRPLTLVSAPAGYGKTTLVSAWLENLAQAPPPVPGAWLSLDEEDNDLVQFTSYLLAAVRTLFPDACPDTLALLQGTNLPPLSVLARSLVNELDALDPPFVLVLDDYHLVHDVAVHDLLFELLAHPPRPLHLVLITRADPTLSLARRRARSEVTEIRAGDLRFTEAETAAFLRQELNGAVDAGAIDDRAVTALLKRVEGWVAGLRLAVLWLRHRDSVDLSQASLDGAVSYVTDYLATEVLEAQPQAVQEYLLRTSILNRFCAPLCQAVCYGCAQAPLSTREPELDGQAFLQSLARDNLFVIPLDDERTWYRYHHMLRELLQGELRKRLSASEMAVLHTRASAWLAEHGLIEEALHHALAAGDTGMAARLVAEHRHRAMNQEQWHRLRRWLSLLPREVVQGDPQLLIVEAWLLIGWAEMAPVAERVGALLARMDPESPDTRKLQAEYDTLRSLIAYHVTDGPQSLALARRALEHLPREYASERGLAVMLKSLACQMTGDLDRAHTVVWEALAEKAAHHPTYHTRVRMTFCFLDAIAADLDGVLQSAGQVLKLGQELNLTESIAHGYYFAGLCHYERNELEQAESSLLPVVKGAYIANLHNFTFSSFLLALYYQAQDRPTEAREVVETAVERAVEMGDVSLLQTARAFQAELAVRQGNVASAHLWARTYNLEPLYVAYRFYVPQITLPRVLLALDTPASRRQAGDVLVRLHDFFVSIHNNRLLIEVLALQALLHDAQDDGLAALATLERAVKLAESGGLIRLYVDLGPRMAGLLERLRGQDVAPSYVSRILAAYPGLTTEDGRRTTTELVLLVGDPSSTVRRRTAGPPVSPLAEPLTRREREVLALLAQGLSNKEIAEQLVLATGSVKQYTHRIYQKLGVKNRRQAVRAARDLGILPPP